jgi:hypothetical protein
MLPAETRLRQRSGASALSRIGDSLERETASRRKRARSLPVPSVEDLRHPAGLELSLSHGDERADQRSNHVVQERVRHGSDRQHRAVPTDGERPKITDGRAISSGMAAEAREVMFAAQEASRLSHRTRREMTGPVPNESRRERIRQRSLVDPVHVLTGSRRESRVEAIRGVGGSENHELGREGPVQRFLEPLRGHRRVGGERCDLTSRMDARIRAPGHGEPRRFLEDAFEIRNEDALDGPDRRIPLSGPAPEPGPVVGERQPDRASHAGSMSERIAASESRGWGEPQQHLEAAPLRIAEGTTTRNGGAGEALRRSASAAVFEGGYNSSRSTSSIRAIGAPSPLRGPSFRIRMYPPCRSSNRGPISWNSLATTSRSVMSRRT